MIDTRTSVDRAFGLAAYLAGIVLMSALAVWCAIAVGGAAMTMIDTAIIDGSGQPVGDRESRRLAAMATTVEPVAASEEAAAAVPSPPVRIQPAASYRAPTENADEDPAAQFHNGDDDTYRTFCVRLCDGYFWPVGFSTTPDRFTGDQVACTSSCNSPAKLFVHKMPGGGPGDMQTLEGLPYAALKTAFRFRTSYDAQCRCQPQPWEQQALDRHRLHAANEAARKGNKVAADTARELMAKVEADRQLETKLLLIATERANKELAALAKATGTRIATAQTGKRRKGDEGRALRVADVRRDGVMRLGGQPASNTRSSWVPASGTTRHWKDRAFTGN